MLELVPWLMMFHMEQPGLGQKNQNIAESFEIPDNGRMHQITWDYTAGAHNAPDGFRIYIARKFEPWDLLGQVQAPQTHLDFDSEAMAYGMVYIVVTAYNDAGESPTEHGEFPGDPPEVP